jgi:RimJ/RimL family protein N-acetyltransferase
MNVHRVTLETYETNEPAIRFFEKVGFVREGLIREAVYDDGRYYNILSFGLLKSEYRKDHNGT